MFNINPEDIFNLPKKFKKLSYYVKKFRKQIEITILVYKNFSDSQSQVWASALTYYSLMSVFPVIALMIAITKGFGIYNYFEEKIMSFSSDSISILSTIMQISEKLLDNTKGSVLAGVGVVVLLWSAMKILMVLEDSFNQIWRVKKSRSLIRRLVDYIAIIFMGPILLVILVASNSFLVMKISQMTFNISILTNLIVYLVMFLVIFVIFSLIYFVLPNTNVQIKSATIAGFTTTIMIFIIRVAFTLLQTMISNYNVIYGSLVFVPIFLIWVQYVWVVILLGAQISFSIQTADDFSSLDRSDLSVSIRKEYGILVLYYIIQSFKLGEKPYTKEELSKKINIKLWIIKEIVNDLEGMGFIDEVISSDNEDTFCQMFISPENITVESYIKKFENSNINYFKDSVDNVSEESKEILEKIRTNLLFENKKLIEDI